MLVTNDAELKRIAWRVFRGWILESISAKDLGMLKNQILSVRSHFEGVSVEQAQDSIVPAFKKMIPLSFLMNYYPETLKIARRCRIETNDLYEIFVSTITDIALQQIYGEMKKFEYEGYSDAKLKGLAFDFTLGIVDSSLKPQFRETMQRKETEAIRLARGRGIGRDEILELILRSNHNAMNLSDFRRQMTSVIRVFTLGGIKDEQQIFEYFKIFLAHKFYQLGTGS